MDKMQFYRDFYHKRHNQAWWAASKQEDGLWRVHFHADFVPSEDWECITDTDLMYRVQQSMYNWIQAIQSR